MGTTRSIYIVAHQFAKALDADNFKKNSEEHCGYFCAVGSASKYPAFPGVSQRAAISLEQLRILVRPDRLPGRFDECGSDTKTEAIFGWCGQGRPCPRIPKRNQLSSTEVWVRLERCSVPSRSLTWYSPLSCLINSTIWSQRTIRDR